MPFQCNFGKISRARKKSVRDYFLSFVFPNQILRCTQNDMSIRSVYHRFLT